MPELNPGFVEPPNEAALPQKKPIDGSKLVTQRFVRMPFYVDAIQVTSENMERVARWCNGDVRTSSKPDRDLQNLEEGGNGFVPEKYIKVRVVRPANDRQSMAFVGDWILYAGTGYKVYTDRAFQKSFDAAPAGAEAIHVARDARSGEFVSRAYAEENPDTTVVETHRDAT